MSAARSRRFRWLPDSLGVEWLAMVLLLSLHAGMLASEILFDSVVIVAYGGPKVVIQRDRFH